MAGLGVAPVSCAAIAPYSITAKTMTARMEHGNYGNGLVLGSWLLNAMYALTKEQSVLSFRQSRSVLAIIHCDQI